MYTPNGASDIISSIHNCQVNVSKTDQNRMPSLTCVRLERKEKTKRKQLYFLLDMLYCIMKYRRRGKEGMGNGE